MYIAQQIDGTFHISPATVNPGKGMRANSKMGILNLITTNRYAAYMMSIMGYVTVTFEDGDRFIEMRYSRCEGLMYLRGITTTMKGA